MLGVFPSPQSEVKRELTCVTSATHLTPAYQLLRVTHADAESTRTCVPSACSTPPLQGQSQPHTSPLPAQHHPHTSPQPAPDSDNNIGLPYGLGSPLA